MVLSHWQFRVIFHPALETRFVSRQSGRILPLTLYTAPIGFSLAAICLGNTLQASAVTFHACTPLLSLYIRCWMLLFHQRKVKLLFWVFLKDLLFHASSPSLFLCTEVILAIRKLRKSYVWGNCQVSRRQQEWELAWGSETGMGTAGRTDVVSPLPCGLQEQGTNQKMGSFSVTSNSGCSSGRSDSETTVSSHDQHIQFAVFPEALWAPRFSLA